MELLIKLLEYLFILLVIAFLYNTDNTRNRKWWKIWIMNKKEIGMVILFSGVLGGGIFGGCNGKIIVASSLTCLVTIIMHKKY